MSHFKRSEPHHRITTDDKIDRFLSEKPEERESITTVTLTSYEGFAAKNSSVLAREFILGWVLSSCYNFLEAISLSLGLGKLNQKVHRLCPR